MINNNLKILYATPSVSRLYTGVYEVEKNLALELNNLGLLIIVHGMIDKYTKLDLPNWLPIKPIMYKIFGPKVIGYNYYYYKNLLNSGADVGHIHSLWSYTSYALYKWALSKKKPYLFTTNAYLFNSALKHSSFKKKIAMKLGFKNIIKYADCIQVNTISEYNSVRNLGFKNPICIISNGVQIPNLQYTILPPWIKNKNLSDKKILLYLSRIHIQKGVDLLIEAWNKLYLNSKLKDWHLIIVGFSVYETPFESKIKKIVNEYNLNDCISLYPGQYDEMMQACYQNCSGFILPSYNEGTSIAALNALAYGKPAVITSGCNIVESFTRQAAIEIELTNDSIENGIIKLINMTNLERYNMGINGRILVEESYSWKSVSLKILEIYEWLNNKNGLSRPSTVIID